MTGPTNPRDRGREGSDSNEIGAGASRRDFLQTTAAAGALAVGVGSGAVGSASADIPTPPLHRDGNLIKDPDGNTVTLRGVNIADPKRINETAQARGMTATGVIDMLTDESAGWYNRMIRVPVQPVDIGEYEPGSGPPVPAFDEGQLQSYLENHLDEVVQRCAEQGVYCIIDYHRHRDVMWAASDDGPINTDLQEEVDTFWDTVAPRYADQSHVLYEVYNEPTEPGMWEDPTTTQWVADIWQLWLEMAQPWVDTIRSHADNLILMGSPSWSQSPEGALVEEFDGEDIAYTYHIYPGHNSSRARDWEDASRNGEGVAGVYEQAPLFVTEFGWEENAGQYIGGTDEFGDAFVDFLEKSEAIHWTAWCADPVWRPVMFDRPFADNANDSVGDPYNGTVPEACPDLPCEWSLTTGSGGMGDDVKAWLEQYRNDGLPGEGTGGSDDTTPPTAPSDLSVTGTSATSVSLDWAAASDDGSGLAEYVVAVDGTTQTVAAGTTSATVDGLSAATTYEVAVTAVDSAGNESTAATVTATTDEADDTTAPSAPSDLTVEATTASSVDLSWSAATDEGGSGLAGYTVSVDGEPDREVGADTTAATVSGLAADTTYEVGVTAVDAAGNESATATVEATTDAEDTGGETPGDALVVNDYDGDPAWSSNQNDLGNWCGAGSFANGGGSGEVVDGALELDYDNAGWFVEQINQDVSAYSAIVFVVAGANGGEGEDFTVSVGGASGTFADLADGSVSTSSSALAIDMESAGVDASSPGELRLNFWNGSSGSSTLTIEEIRLA